VSGRTQTFDAGEPPFIVDGRGAASSDREDLEHIIRAAADVPDQYGFVIMGSQSILA
jgi:hypothetical protein